MKINGEVEGRATCILNLCTGWEWSASRSVYFTPGVRAAGTLCVRELVGLRTWWTRWRGERDLIIASAGDWTPVVHFI